MPKLFTKLIVPEILFIVNLEYAILCNMLYFISKRTYQKNNSLNKNGVKL